LPVAVTSNLYFACFRKLVVSPSAQGSRLFMTGRTRHAYATFDFALGLPLALFSTAWIIFEGFHQDAFLQLVANNLL
jgi:hypothetical protein